MSFGNADPDANTWSFHTKTSRVDHQMTDFQQIVGGSRINAHCNSPLSMALEPNHLFSFPQRQEMSIVIIYKQLVLDYTTAAFCCLSAALFSFSLASALVLLMPRPHLIWLGNTWLSKYQSVSLKRSPWGRGRAYQFHQSSNLSTLSFSSGSSKKSKTVS